MLLYKAVDPDTLELLESLMLEPVLAETRLVGGTALALQYGHRKSVDLDLFGCVEADAEEVKGVLSRKGKLRVVSETTNIKGYFLNEVKIDIVNYPYNWIAQPLIEDNIRLASPIDIAAMKINAIVGRGSRKDFVDLYFLLQHYSLSQILGYYKDKYPVNSEFRALMSIEYFIDAEQYPMPEMLTSVDWNTIKRFIHNKVVEYTREV